MINLISEQAHLIAYAAPFLLTLLLWLMLLRVDRLYKSLAIEFNRTQKMQATVVVNQGASQVASTDILRRVDNKLAEITERVFELQSQGAINRSFEDAFQMVRAGAPAQKLVDSCGLSDGEAVLMVRLHQS